MTTVNLLPVAGGDYQEDWLTEPLQSPYNSGYCVDNGTAGSGYTPEDSSYLYTSVNANFTGIAFNSVPGDIETVSEITVNIRARIEDPSAAAHIHLSLFHSGGTPVAGNPKTVTGIDLGGYGVKGECAVTWIGLSLNNAEADTLFVNLTYHSS